MADQQLATLSAITTQLAALTADLDAAASLDDLSAIEKKAEVLRHMATVAKLGLQWQNQFAALRFRSMRKIGGVLRDMPKAAGGRPGEKPLPDAEGFTTATLGELGFSYNYSSRCQKIAAAPDDVFEGYLKQGEVAGDDQEVVVELTKSGLIGWIGRDEIDNAPRYHPKPGYSESEKTITPEHALAPTESPIVSTENKLKKTNPPKPKPTTKPPKPPHPTLDLTGPDAELAHGIIPIFNGLTPTYNKDDHTAVWVKQGWLLVKVNFRAGQVDVKVYDVDALVQSAAINGLCKRLDFSFDERLMGAAARGVPDDEPDDDYSPEILERREEYYQASGAILPNEEDSDLDIIVHWLDGREPKDDIESATFDALNALGPEKAGKLDSIVYDTDGTTLGRVLYALSCEGQIYGIADIAVEHMFGDGIDSIADLHTAYYEAQDRIEELEKRIAALELLVPQAAAELEGQPAKADDENQ